MQHDKAKLDLYLAHRSALVDYATPILGDRARAEDVVQDAFLRFVPTQQSAFSQPLAYLYRIVRNLALDLTRRRALEQRQEDQDPAWWMLPARPRTPEEDAVLRHDLDRIEAALCAMPPRMRAAVELRRFQGCTLDDIAKRLEVSPATASRLVQEGLLRIATHLGPPR